MLLDKNGKVFGLISIIDAAILLFFVFAVGAGAYSFRENRSASENLTVTVLAEDVSEEVSSILTAYRGEYTDAQGDSVGTVISVDSRQETEWVTPSDPPPDSEKPRTFSPTPAPTDPEAEDPPATPAPVEVPVEDSYDVTIALSCPGYESNDFFLLAKGTAIAPGDLLILSGGGERVQVTVTGVSLAGSEGN